MYESRLRDWGKKEYPLLISDFVDEMEQMTINMNGANVIRAKTPRITAEALANILSSLESNAFIIHCLGTTRSRD
jgi:hypothetical protein